MLAIDILVTYVVGHLAAWLLLWLPVALAAVLFAAAADAKLTRVTGTHAIRRS